MEFYPIRDVSTQLQHFVKWRTFCNRSVLRLEDYSSSSFTSRSGERCTRPSTTFHFRLKQKSRIKTCRSPEWVWWSICTQIRTLFVPYLSYWIRYRLFQCQACISDKQDGLATIPSRIRFSYNYRVGMRFCDVFIEDGWNYWTETDYLRWGCRCTRRVPISHGIGVNLLQH